MYDGIIYPEIMCIFILAFLLFTQIRLSSRTAKDKAFNLCLIVCLLLISFDTSTYIICEYFPEAFQSKFYLFCSAVAYASTYIYMAVLFKYFGAAGKITDGSRYRINKIFRICLYISACFIGITCYTGNFVVETLDDTFRGKYYWFYSYSMIALIIISVIVLHLFRKDIEKSIFPALAFGVSMQIVSIIANLVVLDVDYGCVVFTLVLLTLYILVQTEKIDLSQATRTEMTMAQLKHANELLEKSYSRLEEGSKNIDAIAKMYHSVYRFDLEEGKYTEISTSHMIHELITTSDDRTIQERMWGVMTSVINEDCRQEAVKFTNFSTLNERMNGEIYISKDLKDIHDDMWRVTFVRVGKVTDPLTSVIYTSHKLNEESK